MKILVIGDVHFRDTSSIHEFNTREKNGISRELMRSIQSMNWVCNVLSNRNDIGMVVQVGDVYNSLGDLDRKVVYYANKTFSSLKEITKNKNIPFYIVGGNHDLIEKGKYLTETLPCSKYISRPETLNGVYFIPYMDDFDEFQRLINESKNNIIITHAPIKKVYINGKKTLEVGIDVEDNDNIIISGHIHLPSIKDNLFIVGSLYQLSINEVGSIPNGVLIYDTVSKKYEWIENDSVIRLRTVYSLEDLERFDSKGYFIKAITNDKELINSLIKGKYNYEIIPPKNKIENREITNLYADVNSPSDIIKEYINTKFVYLNPLISKYLG